MFQAIMSPILRGCKYSLVLLMMGEIIARNIFQLIEIIYKIVTVASSWLFILSYQWCTVTQTSELVSVTYESPFSSKSFQTLFTASLNNIFYRQRGSRRSSEMREPSCGQPCYRVTSSCLSMPRSPSCLFLLKFPLKPFFAFCSNYCRPACHIHLTTQTCDVFGLLLYFLNISPYHIFVVVVVCMFGTLSETQNI